MELALILRRLVNQFNLDSADFCGGTLRWSLTAQESPGKIYVRVREKTHDLSRVLATNNPGRVGFLATMIFTRLLEAMITASAKKNELHRESRKDNVG